MEKQFKKIVRRIVLRILLIRGYGRFNAQITMKEIVDDFFMNKDMGISEKIRFYNKGFLSIMKKSFGLNEEKDFLPYLPELKYYKFHPINGQYGKWIDDKLSLRYILDPFRENLPEYYFQIMDGKLLKLADCPGYCTSDINGLISLIKQKKDIALKLIYGTKGKGFYKLFYRDDAIYINDRKISENDLGEMLSSMDNYMATEFLKPCDDLLRIYPDSSNSVRIMAINDSGTARIAGAFIRFGNKSTGYIDNVSAGGFFCGVDITNGKFFKPYRYNEKRQVVDLPVHPDTGEAIKGEVRNWQALVDLLVRIGNYLPQLCYLGYDIIIAEDGFKIIEINSLQGLDIMQLYYPLLKDDRNKKFFEHVFGPGCSIN